MHVSIEQFPDVYWIKLDYRDIEGITEVYTDTSGIAVHAKELRYLFMTKICQILANVYGDGLKDSCYCSPSFNNGGSGSTKIMFKV